MNKEDSLAFLNKCLEKLDSASNEDISRYKAAYNKNCSSYLSCGSFDFCAPKADSLIYETFSSTYEIIDKSYVTKPEESVNLMFKEGQVVVSGNALACAA